MDGDGVQVGNRRFERNHNAPIEIASTTIHQDGQDYEASSEGDRSDTPPSSPEQRRNDINIRGGINFGSGNIGMTIGERTFRNDGRFPVSIGNNIINGRNFTVTPITDSEEEPPTSSDDDYASSNEGTSPPQHFDAGQFNVPGVSMGRIYIDGVDFGTNASFQPGGRVIINGVDMTPRQSQNQSRGQSRGQRARGSSSGQAGRGRARRGRWS
ncbi:hypothetical protein CBS101457_002907 [Exobasidium rhododendri]|nr:hypothetical protein CBS101457_002907 [Exobasidium rhododendri]